MKKLITCALALGLSLFTGCTPSEEQISKTATAVGYAAGLIANQTKIKDSARNAVIEVLTEVRYCVPAQGQSFTDAWTPVVQVKVEELIKAGKLTKTNGEIVKSIAVMAAQAVDYLFDVRFPKAKEYETLVRAGASGALDGFLEVFKPANSGERSVGKLEADQEAYDWFMKNWKK